MTSSDAVKGHQLDSEVEPQKLFDVRVVPHLSCPPLPFVPAYSTSGGLCHIFSPAFSPPCKLVLHFRVVHFQRPRLTKG